MWIALFFAICLLLTLAHEAPGQEPVELRGDVQHWKEMTAAYDRLTKLRAYRVRSTFPKAGIRILEVVNPDRYHLLADFGTAGATIEFVQVGDQLAGRLNTGRTSSEWVCRPGSLFSKTPQYYEPNLYLPDMLMLVMQKVEKVESANISHLGEVMINGEKTQEYAYAFIPLGWPFLPIRERLYVNTSSGLPRRTEGRDQKVFDYFDYNASTEINLPKCR